MKILTKKQWKQYIEINNTNNTDQEFVYYEDVFGDTAVEYIEDFNKNKGKI